MSNQAAGFKIKTLSQSFLNNRRQICAKIGFTGLALFPNLIDR